LAKARRRRHSSTFGGNALSSFDHLNKEDAMEGICDTEYKILYQDDCAEMSSSSNFFRIAAFGSGFVGLLALYSVKD
jgi:hypothetical protein